MIVDRNKSLLYVEMAFLKQSAGETL